VSVTSQTRLKRRLDEEMGTTELMSVKNDSKTAGVISKRLENLFSK
jgi:hypothetical protein